MQAAPNQSKDKDMKQTREIEGVYFSKVREAKMAKCALCGKNWAG